MNMIWQCLFQCILQHIRCSSGVQIHYNDMFENNDFTKKLLTWPSSSLPLNYCNYNLQAYLFNNPLCSNFKYALSTWMQFFQINTFKNRKSWCGLNHTYQQYKSTFYGTWIHLTCFSSASRDAELKILP